MWLEAWSTTQNQRTGDLYRIRYTSKTITFPIKLNAKKTGMPLTFDSELNSESATEISNYEVKNWDLIRSRKYGSERYNIETLDISDIKISAYGKTVKLILEDIATVDVMTIKYIVLDKEGVSLQGTIQNTIHALGDEEDDFITSIKKGTGQHWVSVDR